MKIKCARPEEVVKEAFWLAWKACGKPQGMGVFQDRPGASKQEVWDCVFHKKDYPYSIDKNRPGKVYGDYVFGRMMKVGFQWDDTSVEVQESPPRPDYQSWCRIYSSYEGLVREAIRSLE